ncbi:down syndrome cell adhesion molecule-like protein Dscam2 [Caerostris darwini]|uniref:Down syndrome cell adhesion molecule-like protein Dscam2 n=1 Tax=Caerostris darwini TaxID=1538125 RepID=A0AAV4NLB2_9ARAC|nr:down syndrome cell adhesion molecule-like protein Dscam2 [Caerostris darwini]
MRSLATKNSSLSYNWLQRTPVYHITGYKKVTVYEITGYKSICTYMFTVELNKLQQSLRLPDTYLQQSLRRYNIIHHTPQGGIYFIPTRDKGAVMSFGTNSSFDLAAPTFTVEPPYLVEFYNTNGAEIPCSAHGRPSPYVSWVRRMDSLVEDIPGLRHLRPNGSLVFMPFGPEDYRQDIHASVYKCVASNIVGTVGSRDVHVRAGKDTAFPSI